MKNHGQTREHSDTLYPHNDVTKKKMLIKYRTKVMKSKYFMTYMMFIETYFFSSVIMASNIFIPSVNLGIAHKKILHPIFMSFTFTCF